MTGHFCGSSEQEWHPLAASFTGNAVTEDYIAAAMLASVT
jgi:hypothetical protein